MLLSMTGFGKAVAETKNKKITVEIKSLNSKQLDLNARVPSVYRDKELDLRNIVGRPLERGKIDMVVSVENHGNETTASLNVAALEAYKAQVEEASAALGIPTPDDWYGVLLRFPDTMHNETATEVDEEETEALFAAASRAVAALMDYRRVEGLKLEEFFTARISHISDLLAQIDAFEVQRVEKIRQRIEDGLKKIPGIEIDKGRLEQEMIYYIEKLDVNEEKQRLGQHLAYFIETLEAPRPGQGKKLGFISQEMGREINTLGSKSNDADMQRLVVRMKDELEQIKEQVLNVM
ncbi:MAG: YicC family protein [Muribaculaceae bacterium]|nr:YicC family protein [Muribaculaceae bacterium]MDE6702265.1 YicC family protein [Muribaculaceae bacterium]